MPQCETHSKSNEWRLSFLACLQPSQPLAPSSPRPVFALARVRVSEVAVCEVLSTYSDAPLNASAPRRTRSDVSELFRAHDAIPLAALVRPYLKSVHFSLPPGP
jgi:hypothetical protein